MMIKKIFPFILIAYLGGCVQLQSPNPGGPLPAATDASSVKGGKSEDSATDTTLPPENKPDPKAQEISKKEQETGASGTNNNSQNPNPAEQSLSLTTEKTDKGKTTLSATIKNPPDDFQAIVVDKGNTFSWTVKGYYEGDRAFTYKELRVVFNKEVKAEAVKHHFAVLYGIDEGKMKVDNNDIVIENFDANIFLKALFAMRNSDAIRDLVFNRVDEKPSFKEKK